MASDRALALSQSVALFERALRVLPGGVSSPVRAFQSVGGTPRFMARGRGAWLEDVDGEQLLDLVLSWGPLILGHGHPDVVEAVARVGRDGWTFGAPSVPELRLAEKITSLFPGLDVVRFVCSGTEAVMSAVRLARAATDRAVIVKFEGCYHGHADGLLAAAGSGLATLGLAGSPGVTAGTVADTLVLPFNDAGAVEAAFRRFPDRIAAVVVEPVAGNMGVVPPEPDFLPALRQLTSTFGAVLIFDEVMTGWRAHPIGAQIRYGVTPDLTCLGKVVGGGFPAAAYGGSRWLMEQVAPQGPVYQAGTLAGHPMAMAAGLATLEALERSDGWSRAEAWAKDAAELLEAGARKAGVPLRVQRVGTMFTPFFGEDPVTDFRTAKATDHGRFPALFHGLLEEGIYPPPSAFEAWFTSVAHGPRELAHFGNGLSSGLAKCRIG